jgi:HD superfamily phosphohydrolase YqeK
LLEHELRIKDREILEAVRVHTTGFPGMSTLAKVVYLADCLEPGRDFPGLIDIRNIARNDLDRALLMADR